MSCWSYGDIEDFGGSYADSLDINWSPTTLSNEERYEEDNEVANYYEESLNLSEVYNDYDDSRELGLSLFSPSFSNNEEHESINNEEEYDPEESVLSLPSLSHFSPQQSFEDEHDYDEAHLSGVYENPQGSPPPSSNHDDAENEGVNYEGHENLEELASHWSLSPSYLIEELNAEDDHGDEIVNDGALSLPLRALFVDELTIRLPVDLSLLVVTRTNNSIQSSSARNATPAPAADERQEEPTSLSAEDEEERSVLNDLTSLLECPVCLVPMEGNILLCKKGHSFCHQCRPRLLECPLCKSKFLKQTRNFVLEAVSRKLRDLKM